ncbi:MAG: sn-glycerol-3-phosphate ABC transporter ATP-binding protein UgpC [Bacteroidetes bacterium]|nr:sn-glycerol-3-phosphate ABC transporter ATP-binding protein UgpC [Bacteroidota bacterium]
MASVIFENIRKVYDNGHLAVDGVSFTVADGELIVLVGPSGCGKSTTLRMLAGLEPVTSGSILIDDVAVNDIPSKDRDVAMVFQNYALYPHMTVFNNMAFGLKLRKYSKAEIKKRVEQAAEILGISDILDRKPKQLSGGQQQRVAVGRAIVRKPKVFLFDEPLSNLDAKLRVQMRTELARLHRELNATMVYVTHDQTEAMTLGDRIVVMNKGIIQQVDDPVTLYNRPQNRFVAEFIGSPGMNFISGFIEEVGEKFRFISQNHELYLTITEHSDTLQHHDRVVLGFRPETVKPLEENSTEQEDGIFEAEIVFEEHLGAESYVYGKTASTTFMARVSGTSNFDISKQLRFELDGKQIHLFDTETGQSVL